MLPLTLFAIGQALGILQSVMSGQTTVKYRQEVLEALEQIQQALEHILHEIDRLMALDELYAMRQAMKEADSDINTWYSRWEFQDFLKGKRKDVPPDLTASIQANVKNHLTRLNEAIIGQGLEGIEKPWLQLWVDAYRGQTVTSAIESAFQMFYGYMLAVQLRGLALLSAVNDVDGWDGQLKANFDQQGKTCQQVIDGLPDSDRWAGLTSSAVDFYDVTKVREGEWAGVPDGHVVVACKFSENGEGDLLLRVWHAPLLLPTPTAPGLGFVDTSKITHTFTRGSRHDFDIYTHLEDHGAYHQEARMYVNNTALEGPDGNVIVDVMVNFEGTDTKDRANEWKFGYMDIGIKYKPVNADGSLGDATVLRAPNQNDNWSKLTETKFVAWFNSPDDGQSPAGQTWNTPMTGIRLMAGDDGRARLYCAYAIHRQSYGSPPDKK
ncbi:MAG: hypothetical protein V7641_1942 [Blastocatellia bacterium]